MLIAGLLAFSFLLTNISYGSPAHISTTSIKSPDFVIDKANGLTLPSSDVSASTFALDSSLEAQKALAYIAQSQGIEPGNLLIANEFSHPSPLLNRVFQAVTILNQQDGQFFKLLVDKISGKVEEQATIDGAEALARELKYGKLQLALYDRLQQISDTDVVTVTIIVARGDGQSLQDHEKAADAALAAKYPAARAAIALNRAPMDIEDVVLADKIYKEYMSLLTGDVPQLIQPLSDILKSQKLTTRTSPGFPAVTTTLSKQSIQKIAERGDVGTIFLAESGDGQQALDSATKTNRAPAVWARGYDGTGIRVAIVEDDNVDFNNSAGPLCASGTHNCFLHPASTAYDSSVAVGVHATRVASAVGSSNSTYTGMAPGATIVSAGFHATGLYQSFIDSLAWALDPGQGNADIANFSYGWCTSGPNDNSVTLIDWATDYYGKTSRKLLVGAAGNNTNNGTCLNNDNIWSPSKAWNVLTVGASGDNEDANWSNDYMAYFSDWKNPASAHGDHEKPEVVAPGDNIGAVGLNGAFTTGFGTSFAAPQVAGEAALLIHRNSQLRYASAALKAIIMATATNNIDGPTGILAGQDLKDGAGSINADLASEIAPNHVSQAAVCTISCWWQEDIISSMFDSSGYRYYYFSGQAGDRVRVAISWYANAECGIIGTLTKVATSGIDVNSCYHDFLDTDLDLAIIAPDGGLLSNGYSASWDNNYELVPPANSLVLPQTGTYKIRVIKKKLDDITNTVGLAVTKLPVASPAISSWGANRLDVFARGGDNAIWWKSFNGSAWSAWSSLGGTWTSDPAAVSWGANRIDIFVRGTDNAIWSKFYNGSSWSAWGSLGGGATSAPAVSSWGVNRLDLFVRGGTNEIFTRSYTPSGWSAWASLGGGATSAPAAASWGINRIDMFVRGGTNEIFTRSYTPSGWSAWGSISGSATSGPGVSSWGANRLDVFVRGGTFGVFQKYYNGAWSSWLARGGSVASDPDAVSWSSNRVDLVAQGMDNTLQHLYWNGSAWSWESLGEYP